MKINCATMSDTEIKNTIGGILDEVVKGNIDGVCLENIVSGRFCDIFDIDNAPEDTNGWQLDWWSSMTYKGVELQLSGCAWYGTLSVCRK